MAPQTTSTETSTYVFSPRELQRLAAYRAAVVAGFYNEECDAFPSPRRATAKAASSRRSAN